MEATSPLLAEAVSKETAGKKVLWSGAPIAWDYSRRRWKNCAGGIPFTAFSVFWTWAAAGGLSHNHSKPAPTFFILWGCMFITIGLSMLMSPVFAWWKAGRVFYVVTDRSAVIFEKVWSLKIESFDASGFEGFKRVSRVDQSGDIVFQRKSEHITKNNNANEAGFFGLKDYTEAERALRKMMELNGKPNF